MPIVIQNLLGSLYFFQQVYIVKNDQEEVLFNFSPFIRCDRSSDTVW